MNTKYYVTLLVWLGCSGWVAACDCTATFVPLADRVCRAAVTDGVVLELVMIHRDSNENTARFAVADALVGEAGRGTLELNGGNSGMCGWPFRGTDRPGQRYLYFTNRIQLTRDGSHNLFKCGFTADILRLSENGQRIQFPKRGGTTNPDGEWQSLHELLGEAECDMGAPNDNPLEGYTVSNNPGDGLVRLIAPAGAKELPFQLRITDAAGREITALKPESTTFRQSIDLRGKPRGIYYFILGLGKHRRVIRYLKVR